MPELTPAAPRLVGLLLVLVALLAGCSNDNHSPPRAADTPEATRWASPEASAAATPEPPEPTSPDNDTGQHEGDVRVEGDQAISGQVVGTLTVARSGNLVLYGQVIKDLVVNMGGRAEVYGMVLGDVINRGGDVTVYGWVEGQVLDQGATTTVIVSGAVIGGEVAP